MLVVRNTRLDRCYFFGSFAAVENVTLLFRATTNKMESEEGIFNCDVFKKIFAECLDVTFVICTYTYSHYGPQKFEDIFNRIFPTAIVLKSAYWPFYRDVDNRCLCICKQYGIVCKHLTSADSVHCLDVTDTMYTPDRFLLSGNKIRPLDYNITCLPTPSNLPKGFLVSARIFIKECDCPLINKRRRPPPDYFMINTRYSFVPRLHPATSDYKFLPCPSMKKSFNIVLHFQKSHTFPEEIAYGYKVLGKEFAEWTACAATTLMTPKSYVPKKWKRVKKGHGRTRVALATFFDVNDESARNDILSTFIKNAYPLEQFLKIVKRLMNDQ